MKQFYTFLLLIFIIPTSFAQTEIKGEVLVQLQNDFDREASLDQLIPNFEYNNYINDYKVISTHFKIILLEFDENDLSKKELIRSLNAHSSTFIAQVNREATPRNDVNIPNDSLYDKQWNMDIIKAPEAWTITTGGVTIDGDTIVIANIEDGTDFKHRDLQGNLWYNTEEIKNDGIDNDGNGYIDDYRGWSIRANSNVHPRSVHGTKATGIIGAKGDNGFGVAGVNWNVKIMIISRAESEAEIIQAYDYIYDKRKTYNDTNGEEGAFVVATSLQFGVNWGNPADYPLWCGIYDIIGAEGILNVASTSNKGINVELEGDVPTGCDSDYLLRVANTTIDDELKSSSSYGMVSIDLAAPGSAAYTTNHFNQYEIFSGTSASAPHVSGTVGLLYSMPNELFIQALKSDKKQAPLLLKKYIMNGTDVLPSLKYRTVTEGRLNIFKSMQLIQDDYKGFSEKFEVVDIFPNPTSDILFVNYDTPNEDFQVELYNQLGQKMKNWSIETKEIGTKRLRLNVNLLQSGVYFIILKNSDTQIVRKFVVALD